MALYTPPSLPRTPSHHHNMNATLPSLPTELLSSWSVWRHPKQTTPLTPPMTSTFHTRRTLPQQRVQTTLPPITHLDRHLSHTSPLTPPEDFPVSKYSPNQSSRLPPIVPCPPKQEERQESWDIFQSKPTMGSGAPHLDWLDFTRTRSAHFIAEKTCEMICYLWFAVSSPEQSYSPPNSSPRRPNSLQLVATPTFVQFMQKLLETTQVSQSVIVLSLHYIYRLKDRNRFTPAQPGSEFRIAVAGLMMANKFLDDNTYTNKTWSEVSGIDLPEINRMEKEFLMGVDFTLYVDKPTYESWLNLLKGLVMAKERDSRQFRKTRGAARSSRLTNPTASSGPASRTYTSKYRPTSHRARSTSPTQTRTSVCPYPISSHALPASAEQSSPTPRSGSKRSAAAAFSPTSAAFAEIPSKRPVSISLQIPEYRPSAVGGPNSHSPLEGLQSFATMSLASPHGAQPSSRAQKSTWVPGAKELVPETLVTPYPLDENRRTSVPQNLYFYALACSPMDREEENRSRKAKLRYHQPPPQTAAPYYPPQRPTIPVVQSASTSPHDNHMHVTSHTLPHFHDTQWSRPSNSFIPSSNTQSTVRYSSQKINSESPVPSAPFANAGPPGVHFYPTPVQNSSVYPPNWSRGRRF